MLEVISSYNDDLASENYILVTNQTGKERLVDFSAFNCPCKLLMANELQRPFCRFKYRPL